MAKNRGHGEGSIFQRKDGRWCAVVTVGRDATGRLKRRYIYGETRRDVQEELTKLLADAQRGLPLDPSRQTVGEFLSAWLEDVVKPNLRPKTVRCYEQVIRIHLNPAIGSVPLAKLTAQHLQHLYRQKAEQGLTHTVRLCHAVLHKALSQAVKWGLVARNVADAVDRPKTPRKEMRALTPEEAARFLEAAEGDRLFAMYVLAITCGLRQGELFGLKWEDVDLERATLTVRRQLQWVEIDGETRPTFVEPKSAKSRRTVALPSAAVAALRKHRARQAEERLRLGRVWQDHGLVFCTLVGTPLNQSAVRSRSFNALLEKAGLPRIRFHDLRHTAASLLLGAGESLKTVQEMLGHSSIMLTADVYGHIGLTQQRQAAARMDALLAEAKTKRR